ncbi:hypothetical protein D3C72_2080160 [compost metagenome]
MKVISGKRSNLLRLRRRCTCPAAGSGLGKVVRSRNFWPCTAMVPTFWMRWFTSKAGSAC